MIFLSITLKKQDLDKKPEKTIHDIKSDEDWIDLLTRYSKHKNAYKEHKQKFKELDPIVWIWSESTRLPMINPAVDGKKLSEWKQLGAQLDEEQSQILKIEKQIKKSLAPGRMVTADLLQRLAPAGVSRKALADALGSNERGGSPGDQSFELLMAKRIYQLHRAVSKSGAAAWVTPLYKTETWKKFAQKNLGKVSSSGKTSGFANPKSAHEYIEPVHMTESELTKDDWMAVRIAEKMTGRKQVPAIKNGQAQWKVFPWLRPGQQQKFTAWADKMKEQGKSDDVASVESMRKKTLMGSAGTKKITERYRDDKVQPGTKASTEKNRPTADTGKVIPDKGEHKPIGKSLKVKESVGFDAKDRRAKYELKQRASQAMASKYPGFSPKEAIMVLRETLRNSVPQED